MDLKDKTKTSGTFSFSNAFLDCYWCGSIHPFSTVCHRLVTAIKEEKLQL